MTPQQEAQLNAVVEKMAALTEWLYTGKDGKGIINDLAVKINAVSKKVDDMSEYLYVGTDHKGVLNDVVVKLNNAVARIEALEAKEK